MNEDELFDREVELIWWQRGAYEWVAILIVPQTGQCCVVNSHTELEATLGKLVGGQVVSDTGTQTAGDKQREVMPPWFRSPAMPLSLSMNRQGRHRPYHSQQDDCTLTITGFIVYEDELHAIADLSSIVVDAAGRISRGVLQGILVSVRIKRSTVKMLRLELEPLVFELLGVRSVQTNPSLELTIHSGPSDLQRDLLSTIAHVCADPYATREQLAAFLNQLLVPSA
jgi:hypothetical protein